MKARIIGSVRHAFAGEALPWLDDIHVEGLVDRFPAEMVGGLRLWSEEFASLISEYDKIRLHARFHTREQKRALDQLEARMMTMRHDRDYYPLSFLARVGRLPRYGFPGATIHVVDDRQDTISQVAAVGVTEYAPGNRVYVAGRKLTVTRLRFAGGAKENPRDHTTTYRYCDRCSFMTLESLQSTCPNCDDEGGAGGRNLSRREFVDFVAAQALADDAISDEDEYRDRSQYSTSTYLEPLLDPADEQRHRVEFSEVGADLSAQPDAARRHLQLRPGRRRRRAGHRFHGMPGLRNVSKPESTAPRRDDPSGHEERHRSRRLLPRHRLADGEGRPQRESVRGHRAPSAPTGVRGRRRAQSSCLRPSPRWRGRAIGAGWRPSHKRSSSACSWTCMLESARSIRSSR